MALMGVVQITPWTRSPGAQKARKLTDAETVERGLGLSYDWAQIGHKLEPIPGRLPDSEPRLFLLYSDTIHTVPNESLAKPLAAGFTSLA